MESTNKINDAAGRIVFWKVSDAQTTLSTDTRMSGFTGPMQAMHWITVLLLLGAYSAVWMIHTDISSTERDWLVMLHRSFGITILLATGIRLAMRRHGRVPLPPADLRAIQRFAARASASLLYLMLILQTALGLIGSMLCGDRIVLFGVVVLPLALPVDRVLGRQVFQLHAVAAWLFWRRLVCMWPRRFTITSSARTG